MEGERSAMTLDYSRPWSPRSYPASAIRCRVCDRKFQAGSVPAGDPICLECSREAAAGAQGELFDVSTPDSASPMPP